MVGMKTNEEVIAEIDAAIAAEPKPLLRFEQWCSDNAVKRREAYRKVLEAKLRLKKLREGGDETAIVAAEQELAALSNGLEDKGGWA